MGLTILTCDKIRVDSGYQHEWGVVFTGEVIGYSFVYMHATATA